MISLQMNRGTVFGRQNPLESQVIRLNQKRENHRRNIECGDIGSTCNEMTGTRDHLFLTCLMANRVQQKMC